MKQKLILFFAAIFVLSISCQNQKSSKTVEPVKELEVEEVEEVVPELHSISEIKAILKLADVGFYPEIINEPTKALEYTGDKKIAANIGAYMGDMVYVMSTSGRSEAYANYGAIMELAKDAGLTDEFPKLILERYEAGNTSIDDVFAMIEKALDDSKQKMTDDEQSEFFAYMIYGNYIEKLYVVSSIVKRPKKTDVPAEVEAILKRDLFMTMGKQSGRLQELIDIMSAFPNRSESVIDLEELKELRGLYLKVEAKRAELAKLSPEDLYKAGEVIAIHNQIEKVRDRIVKVQ